LRRFELDEVLDREVFARDGVGVVFGDVRLDQTLFEDIAALARRNGFPWSFSGYGAKHCGGVVLTRSGMLSTFDEVVANSEGRNALVNKW
jgi:hypothetical protein